MKEWAKVRETNRAQLVEFVEKVTKMKIDEKAMILAHTKRPTLHKRHLFSLLGILDAFLQGDPASQFTIFAGKAACDIQNEKEVIRAINKVSQITQMCVLMPNFNVTLMQKIVVGADISENLSVPGSEAGGTSQAKFMMNGCAILGSLDGTNMEIYNAVGENNCFTFSSQSNV